MNFDERYFNSRRTPRMENIQRWVNRFLYRIGMRATVEPMFSHSVDMVSSLQKINFFFLLNDVISRNVPGAVVELGCFDGQTAILLDRI
jgi:O-methyltransferase